MILCNNITQILMDKLQWLIIIIQIISQISNNKLSLIQKTILIAKGIIHIQHHRFIVILLKVICS